MRKFIDYIKKIGRVAIVLSAAAEAIDFFIKKVESENKSKEGNDEEE